LFINASATPEQHGARLGTSGSATVTAKPKANATATINVIDFFVGNSAPMESRHGQKPKVYTNEKQQHPEHHKRRASDKLQEYQDGSANERDLKRDYYKEERRNGRVHFHKSVLQQSTHTSSYRCRREPYQRNPPRE
jgi:hypothetical protein